MVLPNISDFSLQIRRIVLLTRVTRPGLPTKYASRADPRTDRRAADLSQWPIGRAGSVYPRKWFRREMPWWASRKPGYPGKPPGVSSREMTSVEFGCARGDPPGGLPVKSWAPIHISLGTSREMAGNSPMDMGQPIRFRSVRPIMLALLPQLFP